MSQLVFSEHWNLKEIGSNTSELMNLLARWRISRQRARVSFYVLYRSYHQKVWPRFKIDILTSKDLDLGCVIPFQVIYLRQMPHIPHRCIQPLS